MLLSESFEVRFQRYVLLHAGIIEPLEVNKIYKINKIQLLAEP